MKNLELTEKGEGAADSGSAQSTEAAARKLSTESAVGVVFGAVGLLTFIFNLVKNLANYGSLENLKEYNYLFILFGVLLLAVSLSRRQSISLSIGKKVISLNLSRMNTHIQFWTMVLISSLGIMSDHAGQYNIGLMILSVFLGLRYRILKKWGGIILVLFFAGITELSAWQADDLVRAPFIILYMVFFFGISFLIYREELNRHFSLIRQYNDRLVTMEKKLRRYEKETVDIATIPFTPRELDILEQLCVTRESNQQLAQRLGIKEITVKTHLRNIFDKAGTDDRHQLIDLFRGNFL